MSNIIVLTEKETELLIQLLKKEVEHQQHQDVLNSIYWEKLLKKVEK